MVIEAERVTKIVVFELGGYLEHLGILHTSHQPWRLKTASNGCYKEGKEFDFIGNTHNA